MTVVKGRGCLSLVYAIALACPVLPQAKPTGEAPARNDSAIKPSLNAENLVRQWLKRLNALADWVPEKSKSPDAIVDRFADLYDASALQLTGPNENQMGTVIYSGLKGVRKWAGDFARTYSHAEFRIQEHTQEVKTAALFHTATAPWGGLDVAVELGSFYTIRQSNKKYSTPGAAFFDFTPEGKIKFVRLFMQKDETVEIVP
jgi:hypothetical protein